MQFCQKLQNKKEELEFSQKDMCNFLYEVPHRTLQSWLKGEKEPPLYVQRLVMFKLSKIITNDVL
jgi:DNA-binding transcriptional regulator YiaG